MTITGWGVAGNFFFGVVPMVFYGVVNLIAYLLELIGMIPPQENVVTMEGDAGIEKSQQFK